MKRKISIQKMLDLIQNMNKFEAQVTLIRLVINASPEEHDVIAEQLVIVTGYEPEI